MSYKINSPPVSGHFFTKQETIFDHVAWGFELKVDKGNFVCITSYKCVVIVAIKSESGQFLNTGTSHSIVFTIKGHKMITLLLRPKCIFRSTISWTAKVDYISKIYRIFLSVFVLLFDLDFRKV